MGVDWCQARIEDIAEKVGMGPFGSSIKVDTFVSSGIPVISGQHLHGFRVDDDAAFNFVAPEHADRLMNANVYQGDIIFTHAGNIGQVAYIPPDSRFERYVISQRQFFMRPDTSRVLPEFVVAYFKTAEGQYRLLANTSQVGVPSIAQPTTYLRSLEIPLPPIHEQRAIAHILTTLNDKIELNRRLGETLEEMARALFKSWFVDFNPVRAKMEGRWKPGQTLPGLPAPFYDFFPDLMVESKIGEVPKGWSVVTLSDIMQVNPARVLHKGEVAPYLDMANMPTRGHTPAKVVQRPFGSGVRFMNGDTLMARITPSLENGKIAFVDFLDEDQAGWGSTEFIVLRPAPPLPEEYAYCLARSDGFREFAIQSMTGSSGRQRVPPEVLAHFQLVAPPRPIVEVFGGTAKPIFARAKAASDASRILGALRDALLPKLISGELRVKDAERFLEERAL